MSIVLRASTFGAILLAAAVSHGQRDYVMNVKGLSEWIVDVDVNNLGYVNSSHEIYDPTFQATGITSSRTKINDDLWVAETLRPGGRNHAAVRNLSGALVDLHGSMPYSTSYALGLNNKNQVIGMAGQGDSTKLVQWELDGSYTIVGDVYKMFSPWDPIALGDNGNIWRPGLNTIYRADGTVFKPANAGFRAMSDGGLVFGRLGNKAGYWDEEFAFHGLSIALGGEEWVRGFNDNLDVVVQGTDMGGGIRVWNPSTGSVDVNVLNPKFEFGRHYTVFGINNRGQIFGRVADYGGPTKHRGFVLTPVPEPASMAALALGCAALLRRKRRG